MSRERKRGNLSLPALFWATAGGRSPLPQLCPVPDGNNRGGSRGKGNRTRRETPANFR